MDFVTRLIARAKRKVRPVVLPEGQDPRIVLASRQLKDQLIAEPILVGSRQQIDAACREAGVRVRDVRTIDPGQASELEQLSAIYAARRGLKMSIATRVVKKPLCFAGMMVSQGLATAMVCGAARPTAIVIQAVTLTIGLAEGVETASSFFLMMLPARGDQPETPLVYADCALNINPTSEQLSDIALSSAATARQLLDQPPRVAMLSFSTKGSAIHADADKVKQACQLAQSRAEGLEIDGELQADVALVERIANTKLADRGPVAGRANVLIFPDLDAGNIACKLTEHLAGARALGPCLQGFAKPVSDLSRGTTVDEIIATTALLLALSDGGRTQAKG